MKNKATLIATAGAGLVWSQPGLASAHVELMFPPARYERNHQKDGPCGHPNNPPGESSPMQLAGGEEITIVIDEFVDHNSHFRIAIAPSDDLFVEPTAFDDFYNADNVYLDDIRDVNGTTSHYIPFEVPDIDCDPCVMQFIQVMYDAEFGSDDLYFQCADVVIEASAAESSGGSEVGSTGEGTSSEGTGGGSQPPGPDATTTTTTAGTSGTGTSDDGDTTSGTGASGDASDGSSLSTGSAEPPDAAAADDNSSGCRVGDRRTLRDAAPLLGLILLARRRRQDRHGSV